MPVSLEAYWALSRTHTYSLLFAMPLLVLYEALAWVMNWRAPGGRQLRNLADVVLRGWLDRLGLNGVGALVWVLLVVALVIVVQEWRTRPVPLHGWVFGGMALESLALAGAFGLVVGRLTAAVLAPLGAAGGPPAMASAAGQAQLSLGQQLVLSLGAGIYEELLFRVVVVGAVSWAIAQAGLLAPGPAAAVAAAVSALVFSLAHYVGPYGDAFAAGSFVFRFLGGLVFSAIYVLRGFGIVTWTHALYDVLFLLVLRRR